jgi:two-component system CheB/CheR fusion protein
VDYRLISRDGQRRWVLETAKVVTDDMDRFVVGILSDVTAEHEAEKQGQDLALLFETLISSPLFALAVFDASHRVVMVNGTLCDLVGFEQDALVGSPASLFCELPEALAPSQSGPPSEGNLPERTTLTLRHRDGSSLRRPAELRLLPPSMALGSLLVIVPTL